MKNNINDEIDLHDRVAEAYYGKLGEELMRDTQYRIHWICKNVKGKNILDVGCSQGISALLLGREGKNVLGLDISQKAIDEANEALKKEETDVQENITFLRTNFLLHDFSEQKFNTIIIAEVLEHLVNPEEFILQASTLLEADGKLIVTVPFGINNFIDHKKTYYLLDMYKMLHEYFTVEDISILGKWIGYVVKLNQTKEKSSLENIQIKYIENLEKNFFLLETKLEDKKQELAKKLKKYSSELYQANRIKTSLEVKNNKLAKEIETITNKNQNEISNILSENKNLQKKYQKISNQLEEHKNIIKNIKLSLKKEYDKKLNEIQISPSYKLGHLLIHETRNLKSFFMLPKKILNIKKTRKLEKKKKKEKNITRKIDSKILLLDNNASSSYYHMLTKKKTKIIKIQAEKDIFYEIITTFKTSHSTKDQAAIAIFTFFNKDNQKLPINNINGLSSSESTGVYTYINQKHLGECTLARFRLPNNVAYFYIEFKAWKSLGYKILNSLKINYLPEWKVNHFEIPLSNSVNNYGKIASICDTFTEFSFKYDLNLFPLSRKNWKEELNVENFKLLLVESAWNGNNGQWKYCLTNPDSKGFQELKVLVNSFKNKNIKTIFYNKEDSPNYDLFIHAAKLFDIVITSDINCVEYYKKDCGHHNIYVMPFAAQPKIHNPIGKIESDDLEIGFAGTWYKNKHQERSLDMPILLDPASKYNLKIFNRMSDWTQDDSYDFPKEYHKFLHPKVEYTEMLSIHKMFKLMLNINSVNDSESMFSRRIFEILASSTPVISTSSIGINKLFQEIVPIVTDKNKCEEKINYLLNNDLARKKLGHLGHREVMLNHTVKLRFKDLFKQMNIDYFNETLPLVTMAIPTNRPENLKYIKENILRQNYSNLEAIIVLNSNDFILEEVKNYFDEIPWVKIIQLPETSSLGSCLNASIELSQGKYWSKMDDDNIYLENFITDMMLPFSYSEAKIVAKSTYYTYLEGNEKLILRFPNREHQWVDFASGSALIADMDIFKYEKFPDVSIGEDTKWMKACNELGYKMYSADCFNYVVMRKKDSSCHTWKVSDEKIMTGSIFISNKLDLNIVRV